jgi:hypothetical protein
MTVTIDQGTSNEVSFVVEPGDTIDFICLTKRAEVSMLANVEWLRRRGVSVKITPPPENTFYVGRAEA